MPLRIALKCKPCGKVVKVVADPFEAWLCPFCKQPVDDTLDGDEPGTIVLARDSISDALPSKPKPAERL